MRLRTAAAIAAVLFLVAACAPGYAHLEDAAHGGDNTVTAFTGTQAVPTTWSTSSSHLTRRYTGATFTDTRTGGADGNSRTAFTATGSGLQNGTIGGVIAYNDASTLWDDWHYRSGYKVEQAEYVADRVTIRNEGDAFKVQAGARDVRLSRSFIDGSHDDCIQADYGMDGTAIEKVLAWSCYNGISARPSGTIDASSSVLSMTDSILTVADKASCYKPASYGCPNHAGWLKWDPNEATALRVSFANVTFAASSYPEIGSLALNAPIATQVQTPNGPVTLTNAQACHDVTLDFTGPASEVSAFMADASTWQDDCPTGLVINTGQAAIDDLFAKAVAWHQTYDPLLG